MSVICDFHIHLQSDNLIMTSLFKLLFKVILNFGTSNMRFVGQGFLFLFWLNMSFGGKVLSFNQLLGLTQFSSWEEFLILWLIGELDTNARIFTGKMMTHRWTEVNRFAIDAKCRTCIWR